jgi:hypothetical protein
MESHNTIWMANFSNLLRLGKIGHLLPWNQINYSKSVSSLMSIRIAE